MTLNFHSRALFHELLQITQQKDLPKGRALHAQIIKTGSSSSSSIISTIVKLYATSNSLPEALLQFHETPSKTIQSWNSLIAAFSRQESPAFAMTLFMNMHSSSSPYGGAFPDARTFCSVFLAASNIADLFGGQLAHCMAFKLGFLHQNVFVGSSLLNLYSKLGILFDARKVFDEMPNRNSFSWTAIFSGYANQEFSEDALKLFVIWIQDYGINDKNKRNAEFVLSSVLSALHGNNGSYFKHGRLIHSFAIKTGLSVFPSVGNSLVTMYAKYNALADALRTFETLSDKNSISWTAMITGYSHAHCFNEVLKIFSSMRFSGFSPSGSTLVAVLNACSDSFALQEGKQAHGFVLKLGFDSKIPVVTAIVKMYAKCQSVVDARKGFDDLNDEEGDANLWSSLISAYALNSDNENAFALYNLLTKKGFFTNDETIISVLKACSGLASLHQGKQIHARILKSGYNLGLSIIGTILISMYAKCGSIEDGIAAFVELNTSQRDVVSWNSMILGLAQNGRGKEAVALFEEMRVSTKPDRVTFVSVLSACSHMGLVEEAKHYYHKMMVSEYGIIPDLQHHACMVDVLCRSGKVEDAREFIESVGGDEVCLWRILLSGCRKFGDLEVGIKAGERVMELGSEESGSYMVLRWMYEKMGRREDVERVWRTMRERGLSKEVGCSWIEVGSRVHVFVIAEMNHPEIWNVREVLKALYKQMEEEDNTVRFCKEMF